MINRLPAINLSWHLGVIFFVPFAFSALVVGTTLPDYLPLVWFGFYTAISNFFIPWLPLRPMVLIFGALFNPLAVALVGGIATVWIEYFNYQMLKHMVNIKKVKSLTQGRMYQRGESWFKKFPFISIVVAGFSPIPYAPFRVFVATSQYPLRRYLLAVFVGRMPRYYLWAWVGFALSLPLWGYGVIFALLLAIPASLFLASRGKRSDETTGQSDDEQEVAHS